MSSWRPLLRIARRDVRRARGRSLLIVSMVMLPVAGVAFVDVMLRTAQVDGRERLGVLLGPAADVRLIASGSGNPVFQKPDEAHAVGSVTIVRDGEDPAVVPDRKPVEPTSLLPAGSRWLRDDRETVTARTTDGLTRATFRELDYRDDLARGIVVQVSGRAPRAVGEVAVTRALLATLGLKVGDTLELTRPARRLTIVGTCRPLDTASGTSVAVGLPGNVIAELRDGGSWLTSGAWLVDTPEPVTWAQVRGFNEHGISAFSRYVVQHPPARAEVPYYTQPGYPSQSRFDFAVVAAIALVVGLAVLEVALLAGAAFAVGARRQRRALGLLAATGGTARHVRGVVLGQGLVLGVAGGVVGVVLGVAGSFGGIYAANRWLDRSLLGADLRPLELAGLALLGIVTGLVAAVLPARAAARQDVVAALRGRMGVTHTRRRLPTIGLAVAVVGAALALGGGAVALAAEQRLGSASDRTLVVAVAGIVVGAVLTQIGLILATPAIVGAVGRLGRWLPLAPRLALRDAARYRARTAPAVAAILAAVAGSVAVTLFVSGTSDHDRREYTPSLAYGQAVVNAQRQPPDSNYYPPTAEEQVAAVQRVAPPDDVFEVRMLNDSGCVTACRQVQLGVPPRNLCALDAFRRAQGREPTVSESLRLGRDPRCTYSSPGGYFNGSGPVVGGYEDLVRLTGIRSDAARRALAADGMVVFDQRYVDAGQGQLELTPYDPRNQGAAPTTPARVVTTPAAYVPAEGRQFVDGFVSPALAARIGVTPVRSALVLQYETPPSDDVEERVSAELSRLGGYEQFFQVERGYRDNFGIGLLALVLGSAVITLGAAGVATGLAQADGRADHATLAAVGAPPRVRRSLAAWQAAVVGGLGVGLGTLSGFVPMTAYLYADSELRLVPPWRNLALIVVVVPAVAAAGAWLLTRSRLPLERRMEA